MKISMLHLSVITSFLFSSIVVAQNRNEGLLSDSEFKEFLKKEYYFLATPDAKTTLSNFGAFESKDGAVSLQTNFFLQKGVFNERDIILGISAKGAGSSESLPIYSENEFKKNVGFSIEIKLPNYALKKGAFLEYSDREKTKRDIKILKIREQFKIDSLNIVQRKDSLALVRLVVSKELDILEKRKTIKKHLTQIKSDSLSIAVLCKHCKKNSSKIDSLENAIEENRKEVKKNEFEIAEDERVIKESQIKLSKLPFFDDLLWVREGRYAEEVEAAKKEITILGHRVGWWSFKYDLENTNFTLFNSGDSFDNQKKETSFTAHKFSLQYSKSSLYFGNNKSYFYTVGASIALKDNRESDQLSSFTIKERTNYGINSDDRYSIKELTVLTGDYKTGITSYSVYGDLYKFLFTSNQTALHGSLEFIKESNEIDKVNVGIGLLTSFLDKKDEKSVINAELYLELEDVANANNGAKKILDRSSIGIRFAVPFNYKNKNK